MTTAAAELTQLDAAVAATQSGRFIVQAPSREIMVLAVVLAVFQVLDGILTAVGVLHLGTGMEGNVILRTIMHELGAVPALILVKSFAIGVVAVLAMLSGAVTWLATAFRAMIVLYAVAAIIPWTAIIFLQVL